MTIERIPISGGWFIYDWMSNLCFDGRSFDSFEDGEDWLCEKLDDAYETDRGEYYILNVEPREPRYLAPNDVRAG